MKEVKTMDDRIALGDAISAGVNIVDISASNAVFTASLLASVLSMFINFIFITIGVLMGVGIIPFERQYWITGIALYLVFALIMYGYKIYMLIILENNKKAMYKITSIRLTANYVNTYSIPEYDIIPLIRQQVIPNIKLVYSNKLVDELADGVKSFLMHNKEM